MMMPDYPRNQQYLMGQRATLAYKQGELAAEKYLEILWSALRLTVTRLDEVDIARWPFDRMEFEILFEIVNVYHTAKEVIPIFHQTFHHSTYSLSVVLSPMQDRKKNDIHSPISSIFGIPQSLSNNIQ